MFAGYSYLSVCTGSRRAARFAGSVPKRTPTSTELPRANTGAQGLIGILNGVNRPSVKGRAQAEMVPIDSATQREEDCFGEELQPNLATGCAERLANTDLLDSRLDVGEHAVHDADAADDQRDSSSEGEHDRQHVGDLCHAAEEFGERLRTVDGARIVTRANDLRECGLWQGSPSAGVRMVKKISFSALVPWK